MKRGYKCECGWNLERGQLKRHEYANIKKEHAKDCLPLRKELARTKIKAKEVA